MNVVMTSQKEKNTGIGRGMKIKIVESPLILNLTNTYYAKSARKRGESENMIKDKTILIFGIFGCILAFGGALLMDKAMNINQWTTIQMISITLTIVGALIVGVCLGTIFEKEKMAFWDEHD